MVKILIGVVAALVIAAGGLFGFQFYIQHRVAGEVEAAFEQIRATGAKASHGKVSFDLLKPHRHGRRHRERIGRATPGQR